MSLNRTNVDEILPDHVKALLKKAPELTDLTFQVWKPIFGEATITKAVADYQGGVGFMNNLKAQVNKGKALSDRQLRGACNVLRGALLGEETKYERKQVTAAQAPAPQATPPVLAIECQMPSCTLMFANDLAMQQHYHTCHGLVARPDPTWQVCFKCDRYFPNTRYVVAHKTQGFCEGRQPVAGTAVQAPQVQHVAAPAPTASAFKPVHDLDISQIPDGRYAYRIDDNAEPVYLIKRTVKKRYYRTGRFIWGRAARGYNGIVEEGTLEVRKQAGDTRKLVGEQRVGETVYYGEFEDELKEILSDPAKALALYGHLMKQCGYCGRSLTDELSQLRGIGPDCYEAKHIPLLKRRIAASKA